MSLVFGLAFALIFCFGFVVFVGAPYLPTLTPQVDKALALAKLQPEQTLLELGCGDGKVVLTAAKQGIVVVGYELNPILAIIAWARTRRYRRHVTIIWGNFWQKKLPPADAIFVFLLPKYMGKLDAKLNTYPYKPVRLVSFAFTIKHKKPIATKGDVFAYDYQ